MLTKKQKKDIENMVDYLSGKIDENTFWEEGYDEDIMSDIGIRTFDKFELDLISFGEDPLEVNEEVADEIDSAENYINKMFNKYF